MVTKNNFDKLSKKLCAYSAAAGAAVVGGVADDSQAAPQVFMFDTPVQTDTAGNNESGTRFTDTEANLAVIDPTDTSASGLLGLTDFAGGSLNSVADADLAGKVFMRYSIWEDNGNWAGKEGIAFGMITGPGNGVYATQDGQLFTSAGEGGSKGFAIGDVIGDGDTLQTAGNMSADPWAYDHYDNMPGDFVGVGLSGYGAGWSLYAHDNFDSGQDRALGFTLNNRNGFVLVNTSGSGARDRVQILGFGLESDPFVPIAVTNVATGGGGGGGSAVPEPATLAMLAIGGAGLVALRRRRDK